jgi:hypothetical protein
MPRHAPDNAAVDALIAEVRSVIADLRQDRDRWRTAFEVQQRQLPARRPLLWRWLRSTG